MWRSISRFLWKKVPKLIKFRDCSEKKKLAKESADVNKTSHLKVRQALLHPLYR